MSSFINRHLGPNQNEINSLLESVKAQNLSQWIQKVLPTEVQNVQKLKLPKALEEHELIQLARKLCAQNKTFKNYIGQGFSECLPLHVTHRNIIKNPSWYTAYTPYQAEISQGRLEVLLNFQTLICDLTGMDIANASLLDEASASAEAMIMAFQINQTQNNFSPNPSLPPTDQNSHSPSTRQSQNQNNFSLNPSLPPTQQNHIRKTLFMDKNTWPQTKTVLKTRAESLGLSIQEGSLFTDSLGEDVFAVFFQYPLADGSIKPLEDLLFKNSKKKISSFLFQQIYFLTA